MSSVEMLKREIEKERAVLDQLLMTKGMTEVIEQSQKLDLMIERYLDLTNYRMQKQNKDRLEHLEKGALFKWVNNEKEYVDKIKNFDFTEKKLEFFEWMLYY